jgi:hypothetical protein
MSFGPYPSFATNNWCSVLLLSQESVCQNYFCHANGQSELYLRGVERATSSMNKLQEYAT